MQKDKQFEYFKYKTTPTSKKGKNKNKWFASPESKVIIVLAIVGIVLAVLLLRWFVLTAVIFFIYLELKFKLSATYFATISANKEIKDRAKDRRYFAKINDFEYRETAQFTSTIAIADNDTYVKNYVYGTISGIPFWTADSQFDYKAEEGKAYFTKHTATAVFVDNELPNFQIIRQADISERDLLNLDVYTKNVLQITEQFDKKYIFKSPKDYERDALYIFTPELLELIIEFSPWLIETSGNLVVIHYDYAVESEDDYRQLAEMIQQLGPEFIDNTKRYKDHSTH